MACVNCGKIRSAILHGKMAEAAGLTVEVLRDKLGLAKDGTVVDAPADDVKEVAPSKAAAKA